MDDKPRKDDAADHAPRPNRDGSDRTRDTGRQDAPNYDETTDDGRALKDDAVSSANDE